MKITLVSAATVLALSACAGPIGMAYSGASITSAVATGKSIPEHGASTVLDADCSLYNYLFDNKDYYCETQDISRTYNRNAF
jgi:hypothetical protein